MCQLSRRQMMLVAAASTASQQLGEWMLHKAAPSTVAHCNLQQVSKPFLHSICMLLHWNMPIHTAVWVGQQHAPVLTGLSCTLHLQPCSWHGICCQQQRQA
jgi:hypothetical protein